MKRSAEWIQQRSAEVGFRAHVGACERCQLACALGVTAVNFLEAIGMGQHVTRAALLGSTEAMCERGRALVAGMVPS